MSKRKDGQERGKYTLEFKLEAVRTFSANDLDWHKNTFVFAPNAYGKTTFVNVLRSLRDNDPKLIRLKHIFQCYT